MEMRTERVKLMAHANILMTQRWNAVFAVSGNVLVKEECARGPEFWCQDLQTATQCGAVEHCGQHVWKEDVDPQCFQCTQMISILTSMMKASTLKAKIKTFLHEQCAKIPIIQTQCIMMVDTYEEALITILENQFNPTLVCTKLKFCNSEEALHGNQDLFQKVMLEDISRFVEESIQTMHTKAAPDVKEDLPIPTPMCWMCKSFVGKFEAAIPKTAIAKGASDLCLALPLSLAGVCQCAAQKYVILILNTLLGKLGPKLVCGLLFMCARDENCEAEEIPLLESDLSCDTCLAITSIVKSTRGANITLEEISVALSKVCTSAKDWKECYAFIEDHQKELSDLLLKPWNPKITCQTLGACPAPSTILHENTACAAGPSYWCQNLDNARECKAIGHCLAHVWQ